ncbi:MAG TPA: thioesterase family protein [Gemmatales bacterium]|nr:thioesterase family protein [Gemmatales bacterium]
MNPSPPEWHESHIRVRYAETDRMGFLHHAQYFVYFELGRTEMLRTQGVSYRAIEDAGFFLVVVKLECKFKLPARYDDLLRLRTIHVRTTPVRIEHRYELYRDDTLLCEASSTLASVDRAGKLQAVPEILRREE